MSNVGTVRLSKSMSFVLRHQPETIGLTLTPEGFVTIAVLAEKLSAHFGSPVTEEMVLAVAAADNKQRFTVQGEMIRAAQGHSFPVELGLVAVQPPKLLLHGTVSAALQGIRTSGLVRGRRQWVHLSESLTAAQEVGSRRGEAIILTILAENAATAGVTFHQAENGVWLTAHIPAEFIVFPEGTLVH